MAPLAAIFAAILTPVAVVLPVVAAVTPVVLPVVAAVAPAVLPVVATVLPPLLTIIAAVAALLAAMLFGARLRFPARLLQLGAARHEGLLTAALVASGAVVLSPGGRGGGLLLTGRAIRSGGPVGVGLAAFFTALGASLLPLFPSFGAPFLAFVALLGDSLGDRGKNWQNQGCNGGGHQQ